MNTINQPAEVSALVAQAIASPENFREFIRMSGMSEPQLTRLVALDLDEFEFCRWWAARSEGGHQCPAPGVRVWNSRRMLTENVIDMHYRGTDGPVTGLSSLLMEIPGITHLYIGPYEVTVAKADAFDWCEIAPRVSEIIKGINS
jgi:hypothetical protein